MKKIVTVAFLTICTFFSIAQVHAQELLGDGGIGIGYDGFFPDKNVLQYSSKWPFQISPQAIFGMRYNAKNGFDFFFDATVGVTRVQFPVPDMAKSGNFVNQFTMHFMAGSGPRMEINEKSAIIPFIQLGAGFYGNWGNMTHQSGEDVTITTDKSISSNRWVVLAGGGLEWQFYAIIPSSINLQFTYTPMNIYENPLPYTATTTKTSTDLQLQGKMLQMMLSFRVYLRVKKWDEYRQYY